jgi:hypothetical protein
MTTVLASCMRNEGLFVLEWLAYHSLMGFDEIVVVTNDCTDGSDTLLDHLSARGILTHIRQSVPPGQSPQDAGMDLVLTHARKTGITHILHIDSDEFLHLYEGTLADLLARTALADVVPVPWRSFGDSGLRDWQPGALVLEQNTRAEIAPTPGETKFKCLFRVESFARATDHNPLEPLVADPVVLNPDGAPLGNQSLYQKKSSRFRPAEIAAKAHSAHLFHYAVKSDDVFAMKSDRGDGQGKQGDTKYTLGSRWHRIANRNDVVARDMIHHLPALKERLADWRADPATAALENACFDWFRARRALLLPGYTQGAAS